MDIFDRIEVYRCTHFLFTYTFVSHLHSQAGLTVLMQSINKGMTEIMKLLLKNKADANHKNEITPVRSHI